MPRWETAFFDLLHPAQVAIVEACLWIDQPLSATLLAEIFEYDFKLDLIAYHVRRLADRGILHEVSNRLVRSALEHFYLLVAEPQSSGAQIYATAGNGLAR